MKVTVRKISILFEETNLKFSWTSRAYLFITKYLITSTLYSCKLSARRLVGLKPEF